MLSADDYTSEYMRSLALIFHDGKVFWPPPTKFRYTLLVSHNLKLINLLFFSFLACRSTCPVNVAFFPFDDQVKVKRNVSKRAFTSLV